MSEEGDTVDKNICLLNHTSQHKIATLVFCTDIARLSQFNDEPQALTARANAPTICSIDN